MFMHDDNATDDEPTLTDAQLEIAKRAAGDFEPIPVSADDAAPADGKAPQLAGREAWMRDVRDGKFMKRAADEGEDASSAGTEAPKLVGREGHMRQVAAGKYLGGAK
jgi:hypothetical protein